MSLRLDPLPPTRAAGLAQRYAAAVSAARLKGIAALALLAALTLLAGHVAEVRPGTFLDNIANVSNYLVQILPTLHAATLGPDLAAWYWGFPKWLALLAETLLMAYLGTLLGGLGAFALGFCASANLVRSVALRFLVRRLLELCRTVPEIVIALIFVIAFGLGPMVGVMALAIHTAGALGKLFSEVVENADMKPVEGLAATGATWVETVRFGVVPQVLPSFASYALLRFEINVRGAGVLGFVGAGGIGQEFLVAIRNFYYTDVSAILAMIIATVVAIDLLTQRLRQRLQGDVA